MSFDWKFFDDSKGFVWDGIFVKKFCSNNVKVIVE